MISNIRDQLNANIEILSSIFFVSILISIEYIRPLKKSSLLSRDNLESIFWIFLNKLLNVLFLGSMIVFLSDYISRNFVGATINLEDYSIYFQFFIFFLGCDFLSFLSHRFLHHNNYLWKFHQLHHSSENLTTWSSFRVHWLEEIYYGVSTTIFASFFIMDTRAKLGVFIITSLICYIQHANIRLRLGNWINWFVITPLNHRWHHSMTPVINKGQNFGLFLSLWDKMFNTFYVPDFEPGQLGVGPEYPKEIWKKLLYPFLK